MKTYDAGQEVGDRHHYLAPLHLARHIDKLLLMIIALGEFCRISGDNALRS